MIFHCLDEINKAEMVFILLLVILLKSVFCVLIENSDIIPISGGEYCQFENFNPKCPSSSAILITKALFGRMRKGRCISDKEIKGFGQLIHDQKYLGCHVDVLDLIGEWCSMTTQCLVKVSDTRLTDLEPCLSGLNMYLEADYTCVPVYYTEESSCILPVFHNGKYLLVDTLKTTKCGKFNSPWILEAMKGQRIIVKLARFETSKKYCEDINIILQDGVKNSTLCGNINWIADEGLNKNEPLPYKSTSNVVKIFVNDLGKIKFALKIEAEGCLDIIPPEDAWLKRTNDDIVIGCYSSKQTWYLRCENNKWIGTIGNCSHPNKIVFDKEVDETIIHEKIIMSKHHQVLIIVAIIGIGIVICSAIICVGAVCARRYRLANKMNAHDFKGQNLLVPDSTYNQHTYNLNYDCKIDGCNNGTITNGRKNLVENGASETYFVLEDDQTMAIK